MSREADLMEWHGVLQAILTAVADATRLLGISRASVGVSEPVQVVAAANADALLERITTLVRQANRLATMIADLEPPLGEVVHPLLGEPGAAPAVQLRPWWARLFDKLSSRTTAHEQLETLRLEADAAAMRAATHLGRR